MLELNKWFFVLLALFLSTYFILDRILFHPLLLVFKERKRSIDGSMEEASEMREKKEKKLEEFKRGIIEGSRKAKAEFEGLREEGLKKQRGLVDAASKEAMGMIERARKALRAESERARAALKGDAEKYAEQIVDKLLRA